MEISVEVTKDLRAAAAELQHRHGKLPDLERRAREQAATVQDLREQLDAALGRDLSRMTDPDAITKAKRECAELDQQLKVETDLMRSIETAIQNLREDGKTVSQAIVHQVDRIVLNAVTEAEPDAIKRFNESVRDLMTIYLARHGAPGFGAVERLLYRVLRRTEEIQDAHSRVSALKRSLFEAVE